MSIVPLLIKNLLIQICLSSNSGLLVLHRLLRIIYLTKARLSQLSHIYNTHWHKRFPLMNKQSQRTIELSDIQLANNVMILNENEDIIILWFDDKLDPKLKDQLVQLHDHTRICSTKNQLIDSVDTVQMHKIILIVSGQRSREALELLHNNDKIDSIYIFCMNNQLYEDLVNSKRFRKLIGIYTKYEDLFKILEKQIRSLTKHLSIFTLFSRHNKSVRNLENESIHYLWYQLLRDTLMNMETHDSKQEMLDYCRTYYHNDYVMLKEINEFEKKFQSTETIRQYSVNSPNEREIKQSQGVNQDESESPNYQSSNAIQWYTNNSFPFKFLNQALRTENVAALYKLRYFLTDICRSLKLVFDENFELYQNCFKPYLTVYRGLTLSDSDIEQLKQFSGKYVSTNGFLSTSLSRQIAETFATNVLFEIKINMKDKSNNHLIYAIIMEWSLVPNEEEVLFDIGALFQITDIKYETDKWIVSMVDVDYDKIDYLKNDYITTQRFKMEDGYLTKLLFGRFLFLIGQFDKAIEFYENLLNQHQLVLHDQERYMIFAYLSDAYNSIRQYDVAIEYSIKALDLEQQLFLPSFAPIYRLISKADTHRAQNNVDRALNYYEEALSKFDKNTDKPDIVAVIHSKIGQIRYDQRNYLDALKHFQLSVEVYDEFYPNNFEKTIAIHFDMGRTYDQLMNYSMALKHFQISLISSKQFYPDDHEDVHRTYILIGMIYYKLGQYDLALENLAGFESKEFSLSNASIYNSIGECYDKKQQYEKAIEFYTKSLNIIQRLLKNNGPLFLETELGRLNNCIGLCYDKNNQLNSEDDYKKSLEHYNESLKYYEQWDNFENCIIIYKNISMLYLKNNNYQLAIECAEKALNIQENSVIPKDKEKLHHLYNLLAILYSKFGIYYFDEIKNYDLSIEQFKKVLDIRQNLILEMTNTIVIADLYRYIGACYCEKNAFNVAIQYYEKSLELVKHENDEEGIATLNNNIADCNKKLQNISQTFDF